MDMEQNNFSCNNDLSSVGTESCENSGVIDKLFMMSRGNRSNRAMLLLLDSIIKLSQQKPKTINNNEPIRVLVASYGGNIGSSMEKMSLVQKVLEQLNIDVVFVSKDFSENINSVHTFSGQFGVDFGHGKSVTVEQKIGNEVRKEIQLQLLNTLIENQTELVEERLKHFDKKIPIKGKFSKKGKSNNFGSRFHK